MNDKFEEIMLILINKQRNFHLIYIIISILLISGLYLRFIKDEMNIGNICIFFGLFFFILIPIKIRTINKHKWIMKNYITNKDQCLGLLYAYKHNLNGTSIISYSFLKAYNKNSINLYNQAIKILKTEVKI